MNRVESPSSVSVFSFHTSKWSYWFEVIESWSKEENQPRQTSMYKVSSDWSSVIDVLYICCKIGVSMKITGLW